ncbi:MAG: LON peptidase substrate-binding domain-containing protein [Pseudomonadota bacterium]
MDDMIARRGAELPETTPLFPLAGALLLPGGQLPLNIFEPRYLRMVDDALGGARSIAMIQPRNGGADGGGADGGGEAGAEEPLLYGVGCVGRITSFSETDDGRYLINLTGVSRFRLAEELSTDTPYRQARASYRAFPSDVGSDPSAELVDRARLERAMREYLDSEGLKTDWEAVEDAPTQGLVVSLAMGCPFAPNEKQALLEAEDTRARAECLIALMEMARGENTAETRLQ